MSTPTAPLPAAAEAALVTYETARLRAAELAAQSAAGGNLAAVDVRAWEFAEELMAGARATLAAAGQLHLIGGAR